MRNRFIVMIAFGVFLAGLGVPAALAQTGSVKGVCKDQQGNIIAGATVEWTSTETGRKYTLKTNNRGEYFSLGIAPGKYNVRLLKDNAEIWHINNVSVSLDELDLDFDLKKEQISSAAKQGMSAEQVKAVQEQAAKAQKENLTVKTLNEKLAASNQASQAGDYEQAITILAEATQMDPSRDLLWFKLGDAYRMSATKQTDPAEKQKRYDSAVEDYKKAIQIKGDQSAAGTPGQAAPAGQGAPANPSTQQLAAYYNNLAEVYAKSGKVDDAVKSYTQAAQINPAGAAQYEFNVGAVLTNAGKVDDAIVAFDKVIAADPTKADAYYWKGVNMIGKATLKGDKMVAPDGTADAFNKYLELAPTGTYAEPAKQMLASIGATVETQFGKKKAGAKKQ